MMIKRAMERNLSSDSFFWFRLVFFTIVSEIAFEKWTQIKMCYSIKLKSHHVILRYVHKMGYDATS